MSEEKQNKILEISKKYRYGLFNDLIEFELNDFFDFIDEIITLEKEEQKGFEKGYF